MVVNKLCCSLCKHWGGIGAIVLPGNVIIFLKIIPTPVVGLVVGSIFDVKTVNARVVVFMVSQVT